MFRIIDDNGSRKLDLAEFLKGMSDFGVQVDKEEAIAMFKSMDKDESGQIDFDEFLIAIRVSNVMKKYFIKGGRGSRKPVKLLNPICPRRIL